MTEPANLPPVDWEEFSELHMTDDGGGVLSSLKAIRQGPLADLVRFVSRLPEAERRRYVIEIAKNRTIHPGEIVMLSRRSDFPGK